MAAVFAVLYGLLYMILSLEDYALLAGALLGFAALTTVMFATLPIVWSGAASRAASSRPSQRTVLSILARPTKSWTARQMIFPVRRWIRAACARHAWLPKLARVAAYTCSPLSDEPAILPRSHPARGVSGTGKQAGTTWRNS